MTAKLIGAKPLYLKISFKNTINLKIAVFKVSTTKYNFVTHLIIEVIRMTFYFCFVFFIITRLQCDAVDHLHNLPKLIVLQQGITI